MPPPRTARHLRNLGTLAAAITLAAAGGTVVWASEHRFWGTVVVALLVVLWLAILLWAAVTRADPRGQPAPASDPDDERIMLRVLLDQAPGALLAVESGGHVRALNRAARRLFATDDRVLPAPPALLSADTTRLRHGGRSWRIDRAVVDALGTPRTLVALVDVEPEEHAAEARATRELLRVLGHEVMNALAPITSLAESALGVLDAPAERRERLLPDILGTLARRTDGLQRFTEAYRQVARLPEPTIEPVRLCDLLADCARLFDGEWQGRATLTIDDPGNIAAPLDRGQVTQALLAVLRNGAEAGAGDSADATVHLAVTDTPARLIFAISDDGTGVAPADRASIFLPFFTTKPEGNGIGLAAARQIAQAHGGELVLNDGLPTTFALTLPK